MVTPEEKKMLLMEEVSEAAWDWAVRYCVVKEAERYLKQKREQKIQRGVIIAWLTVSVIACLMVAWLLAFK